MRVRGVRGASGTSGPDDDRLPPIPKESSAPVMPLRRTLPDAGLSAPRLRRASQRRTTAPAVEDRLGPRVILEGDSSLRWTVEELMRFHKVGLGVAVIRYGPRYPSDHFHTQACGDGHEHVMRPVRIGTVPATNRFAATFRQTVGRGEQKTAP